MMLLLERSAVHRYFVTRSQYNQAFKLFSSVISNFIIGYRF